LKALIWKLHFGTQFAHQGHPFKVKVLGANRRVCVLFGLHTPYLEASIVRPGTGAEYCDQPVCLSVVREHNRKIDFHEILYADPLWPWLSRPLAALRYILCTSGFMDDVTFDGSVVV